jgi:Type II CAAX prenyl endopeptidase Rce1-like
MTSIETSRTERWFSLADVTLLPAFILWFIWRLQFTARWTWLIFIIWIVASFLVRRDTPKTLGWRADNLGRATKQSSIAFGLMAAALVAIGFVLGQHAQLPPNLVSWRRLWTYFAFCLLQQVALNSLVHNRMLSLIRNEYVAAGLTGAIFAACHWPNPVLVPLTLVGGAVMAWLFGRVRNIIPLAMGQAILGSIVWWAFPVAWHHHLRVGPGYYGSFR